MISRIQYNASVTVDTLASGFEIATKDCVGTWRTVFAWLNRLHFGELIIYQAALRYVDTDELHVLAQSISILLLQCKWLG